MKGVRQVVLPPRPASGALEAALLGPDHPLVQASDLLQSISRQWIVVLAVLVGATAAVTVGYVWAWMVILGAGIALSILALLAAGLRQCKRHHAVNLILTGCQNFPIAAIQDQRRRLLSARTRSRLAHGLIHTVEELTRRPRWQNPGSVALLHPRTAADVIDDTLKVVHALATEEPSVQGIARAERLLTDGASPGYDYDMIALRAELHRIRDDLLSP